MFPRTIRGIFFFFIAASLLFLSLSSESSAQASTGVIWNSENVPAQGTVIGTIFTQPVSQTGGLIASAWLDPDGSSNDRYVWDDFKISTAETVTEIHWIGGYDPLKFGAGGPVVDFTVSIYPSIVGGLEPYLGAPPPVQYQTGGNAGETLIGVVNGTALYSYAFRLPASFSLAANTKYWVYIVAFQHGSNPDWGIAEGTGGDASHYVRESGTGGDISYRHRAGDGAFTLLGPVPDKPTNLQLSGDSVSENRPANSIVGNLTATHPNPAATFTFSLTCATAGADDGSFNISDTVLQTSASFDFETKSAYNICVRVTDQAGATLDKNFLILVSDVNEAPTAVSLSNNTIDENQPINSVVGTLSTADPDTSDTHTYSLACTAAGADNSSFNINGTKLQTTQIYNNKVKSIYKICVRVTDLGGLTFDKEFSITVIAKLFLPTLTR